jgi:uncharacterized protein
VIPSHLLDTLRRDGSITIEVKAIPKSSRNEIVGLLDNGALKLKITAAPEKGKANDAICGLLAQEFGVSKKNVRVTRGQTSPAKRIVISI